MLRVPGLGPLPFGLQALLLCFQALLVCLQTLLLCLQTLFLCLQPGSLCFSFGPLSLGLQPGLFGTLLGLGLLLRLALGGLGGDGDSHRYIVAAGGVVAGGEAGFGEPLASDEFALHPVGSDAGDGPGGRFVVERAAVAVDQDGDGAGEYRLFVLYYAREQTGQLGAVVSVSGIEAVVPRLEPKVVDGVALCLCHERVYNSP